MDNSIDRLPKASKSVLNLRLSTSLDASQVPTPAVSSARGPAPSSAAETADTTRPLYSTASMYGGLDTQRSFTADALGSKVSLWDLRCEVKSALETSTGATEAPMRSDALQRILEIMREHVHHRKTQRTLKKEAKEAVLRAEMAEREAMALRDKVAELTQQLADADAASCDSPIKSQRRRASCEDSIADTAPVAPSRWLLSAQTASDAAGPGSAALLTDDAARNSAALLSRESMDAKSLKSDGLMGDEVEGLMSGAAAAARGGGRAGNMSALMTQPAPGQHAQQGSGGSSPSRGSKDSPGKGKDMLRSALLALADERRKNQNLEAQVAQLRGQLDERASAAEAAATEEPPLSARGSGWNLMSMLSRNTSIRGVVGDGSARLATAAQSAVEQEESPTHGTVAEMMMALAETKVTCAEVQGKLTAARRDLTRLRDVNAALTAQVATLTDERDGSWEEVGKMMVQIHMLKGRLEKHGVTVSAEELERAASSASAASLMSARRAASKTLSNSPGRACPADSPGRAETPKAQAGAAGTSAAAAAAAITSPGQESSAASSTALHDLTG